jgi:N6-L-threonylcarbamoyladenine synthase
VRVLGIESSCDETAAAVVGPEGVLCDVVYSQDIHAEYGGVVPELAARAHVEKIATVVRKAMASLEGEPPDAVAATAGPGLIGAVLVGLSFAKSMAAGWGVPFVGVNHLEGHLLSPTLEPDGPAFPYLCLVVSGGHTTLYLAEGVGRYQTLGETVDDAAGEAFDKVARMLDLGYPGGPVVDRRAQQGHPEAVAFPRPDPGGLDWSFSGLKTAVRQHLQRPDRASTEDVCASFQAAVVDCLADRVLRAAKQTGVRRVGLAGGVAANGALRERFARLDLDVTVPPRHRCTDNGAMIAHAGRMRLLAGERHGLALGARPQWPPHLPAEVLR